jgi:hypothetical protein
MGYFVPNQKKAIHGPAQLTALAEHVLGGAGKAKEE